MTNTKSALPPRSTKALRQYRDAIAPARGSALLVELLDRLLLGDESVRAEVERALDAIDCDSATDRID